MFMDLIIVVIVMSFLLSLLNDLVFPLLSDLIFYAQKFVFVSAFSTSLEFYLSTGL
jgi:hypothetical protein